MVGNFMAAWSVQQQNSWRKGPWTPEEDKLLVEYVNLHGEGRWSSVARCAGLNRSGKSSRLRWVNYLRPGLKRGQITSQEEGIIIELHAIWGNKWSTIARYLPGRTDNEIKNYWRTHFKKKERSRKASGKRKTLKSKPKEAPQSEAQELIIESRNEKINHVASSHQNHNIPDKKMMSMYPNTTIEDQNLMMITASSWMDAACRDQDGAWWGSLWSFDEQMQQDSNAIQNCSKMMTLSLENQAYSTNNNIYNIVNNNNNNNNNGFSWEGDPYIIYNEGYIF